METGSFVLSANRKDIIKDLRNLEDLFDFSNSNENDEIFINKNKKVVGKYKLETPKSIWIDEFVCLRSKMYAPNCGDDSKNKLKGISENQSKNIKFDEYRKCLNGDENQREINIYFLRSDNHEMHLQEIKKSTLSIFDDKRCYRNETENEPWN